MSDIHPNAIAVVGMACRFPGARTPDQYWKNIASGVEAVQFFSESELLEAGVDPALLANPNYVRGGVVLEDIDQFDAGFFGLSPKEAAIMDPQHRQFLETSWEAIESSGHVPEKFPGSIGVFAGCGMNSYFMFHLLTNRQLMESTGMFLVRHTGNDKDFLSTRVSYQFNLRGPSISVQTACSTSLVAIHMASQSLLSGECDMALAGGVTIELPQRHGYMYEEGEILSHDGHCRSFDADSTGTIFGSGAGVVVLRRLSDAIESRDTIYAVIRGSAINNDGSSKVGYLAPSVDGQAKAISEALAVSDVDADSITYVETHGTGTKVGDPIEVTALTTAFSASTSRKQFCGIGSVKSNIGHLDTAAGVASFIKAVQALRHKQLPPSLHFKKANPLIDFEASPFYVNTELRDWQPGPDTPRRAGVSSLGVGGTNAHVIVEEAPAPDPGAPPTRSWQLFPMSARTDSSLDALGASMAEFLGQTTPVQFADAAYTAQTGRKRFKHRRILVARDGEDAARALQAKDRTRIASAAPESESAPSVVFLFPGGGAQYPNMARGLYESEEVFRRRADECFAILKSQLDYDLKALMFPEPGNVEEAGRSLQRPLNSILSIFIVEYATAHLWMSWGVTPAAMTGHSLGEYTAACLSGVISLRNALSLVLLRGRLFERMPKGGMLSVLLPESKVAAMLDGDLSIAAVNGPESCVVSGQVEALERLEQRLAADNVQASRLHIDVAAHSPMLEPFLPEFEALAKTIPLGRPSIPYVSNLTGAWIRQQDLDPTYWVRHLRQTVRFSNGLDELLKKPGQVLLEAGPGTTLSSLVQSHPAKQDSHTVISCIRHPKDPSPDEVFFGMALGRLWMAGFDIDWDKLWQGQPRTRIAIPTYRFDHHRYWIERGKTQYSQGGDTAAPETSASPAGQPKPVSKVANMDNWFWVPKWKPEAVAAPASQASGEQWLIFADRDGFGKTLASRLRERGQSVTLVTEGPHFGAPSEDSYVLTSGDRAQFDSLVASLVENGRAPRRVVYLWPMGAESAGSADQSIDLQVWTPVSLIQALAAQDLLDRLSLTFVSSGACRVHQQDGAGRPDRAMLAGPAKVIPQEFPGVAARWVDIQTPANPGATADILIAETLRDEAEPRPIAYREGNRLIQVWEQTKLTAGSAASPVRDGGVYVFTGGLGDMALTIAGHLAHQHKITVALLHRSAFPDRSEWDGILAAQPHSRTSRRIRAIQAIEANNGCRVILQQADISGRDGTRQALHSIAQQAGGRISGIFHTAGVIDDGVVTDKRRSGIGSVLAPKVQGTIALDAAVKEAAPEFLLLCSSTSALLGLAGQVDYAAANAYLDAYAQNAEGRGPTKVLSVNWGIWSEVGMAARSLSGASGASAESRNGSPVVHPLLGETFRPGDGKDPAYVSFYHPASDWVLAEHKLASGSFVLPGSAYAELVIAAARGQLGSGAAIIRNLNFIAPLAMESSDGEREVQVRVSSSGDTRTITVSSISPDSSFVDHAQAEFGAETAPAQPAVLDLEQIRKQCNLRVVQPDSQKERLTRQEEHLHFGPRWANTRTVSLGERQLLAEHVLPDPYHADLADHPAHPAVLDMATGAGLALIPGILECTDLFVPMTYGRIRVHGPLSARVFSHVRLRGEQGAGSRDVTEFDVTICDPDGRVLLDIERFTMRRVSATAFQSKAGSAKRPEAGGNATLQAWLAAGIRPQEGALAVDRLLAAGLPQVAASSIDLGQLLESSRPKAPKQVARSGQSAGATGGGDEIENFLLDLWTDLLGVPESGLDDDFFACGGHSLVAVRLFAKIRKAYHVDLGLATLFEARTVRQLAALIRTHVGGSSGAAVRKWSCLVPLRKDGAKPLLFCVHGVGGNVLGYKSLVERLPEDQPFYAIQAYNLSRKENPVTCMKTMAAEYVKEIVALQPQGPYYICGYSFGGLAAFEIAQQLTAMGHRIAFLGMFDTDRPGVELSLPTKIRLNLNHLWKLEPAEKKKYAARKLGQVAEAVSARLQPRKPAAAAASPAAQAKSPEPAVLDVRAANFEAYKRYRSGPFPGTITLFRATEFGDSGYRKPNLGWNGMATAGLDVRDIPGNHMTILYEPNVSVLARKLTECLDEIYAREGVGQPQSIPTGSHGK